MVLDNELQEKRVIRRGGMVEVNDVAELDHNEVVIAAHQGLYHYHDDGGIRFIFKPAKFTMHYYYIHIVLWTYCDVVFVNRDFVFKIKHNEEVTYTRLVFQRTICMMPFSLHLGARRGI